MRHLIALTAVLGLAIASCGDGLAIDILVENGSSNDLVVVVGGGRTWVPPAGYAVPRGTSGEIPILILGQDQGFVGVFDLDCHAVAAFDLDPGDYRLVIEEGPRATIVPDTVPDDAPELTATTETCGVGPTPPY